MNDFKEPYPKHGPFKCCTAWHLHKSGQALAIYDLIGAVTSGGKTPYFSSIEKIAEYFGMNYEAARRTIGVLVKIGFLRRDSEGPLHYVSHNEWVKHHAGKCTNRELLPWQETADPFVGKVWKIAGGKIRVVDWQVAAIEKFIGKDFFLVEFQKSMDEAVQRRVPGGDWSRSSPKAVFWDVFNRLKTVEAPTYR